jgi:sulfite dehydrogenase (cytochrome) subunit A
VKLDRRTFVRLLGGAAFGTLTGACLQKPQSSIITVPEGCTVARLPEKTELIMLTDRPPQLETPLYYFRQDLTPNEAFFVRWHLSGIPVSVSPATFRLEVGGHVETPVQLSLDELQKRFEPVSIVAVNQCSGNSRSFFSPRVAGGQWGNGAMGNARWTGVLLKDVLKSAGIKSGAMDVSFAGLDEAPLSSTPKFVKALPVEQCLADQIMIAYQMNDQPLPLLNGYPLRLVVPGWYATYWVKSLNRINVLDKKFIGYWMDTAYRIPKNALADETPEKLAVDTVPINKFNLRSLFVRPEPGEEIKLNSEFPLEGLAFDSGYGIKQVDLSFDAGQTWQATSLDSGSAGLYSWRRWRYAWRPSRPGVHEIMVRATNNVGDTQPTCLWNKSGYMRNVVERIEVTVLA